MEITVNTVTGQNITLKFENPELVKHVDIRVKTEMLIFVETGGEKLQLKVERTQTVARLKQLIVQMKKNKNFIGGNSLQYLGKLLEDSKMLADYDIKEGSTLQAVDTFLQLGFMNMQQQQLQRPQAFASMNANPASALLQQQPQQQQAQAFASMNANPVSALQQQQLAQAFASMNANPASASSSVNAKIA